MKNVSEQDLSLNQHADLPTMMTIICHLMTLYAMRPCTHLATSINRHMNALLNSSESDSLGEWFSTFQQLHIQWNAIANRHNQQQLQKEMFESKKTMPH